MIIAHINVYKTVQQAVAPPGNLVADTLTRPDAERTFSTAC